MPGTLNFFEFITERENIRLRRAAGQSKPWTDHRVLQQFRFCNVFREDDRTTRWFNEHIRGPLAEKDQVVLATICFRWFNKVETGEFIKKPLLLYGYMRKAIEPILHGREKLFTGAYMIKSPAGMDKLTGILNCLDSAVPIAMALVRAARARQLKMEEAHAMLQDVPYLGRFMAYEIVTDLRFTWALRNAPDIMSWASAGPGCARGLGWIYHDNPETFRYTSENEQFEMLELMRDLLKQSKREWKGRPFEMREVEHALCEYDKYRRGLTGQSLKRRFEGS